MPDSNQPQTSAAAVLQRLRQKAQSLTTEQKRNVFIGIIAVGVLSYVLISGSAAQSFFGKMYYPGMFGMSNPRIAVPHLLRASKKGAEESIELLRQLSADQAASSTLPAATLYSLGMQFVTSKSFADPKVAVSFFRKAVTAGSKPARLELAKILLLDPGVLRNAAEALPILEAEALAGSTVAQAYLGVAFANGIGVTRDYEKGVALVRAAAAAGDAAAKKTFQKYVKKPKRVSKDPNSAYESGVALFTGEGVKKDSQKGLRLLQQAAAAGSVDAQLFLGQAYLQGIGVAVDLKKAVAFLVAAAHADNDAAQFLLGELRLAEAAASPADTASKKQQEALEWFTKAAEAGNTDAESRLNELVSARQVSK